MMPFGVFSSEVNCLAEPGGLFPPASYFCLYTETSIFFGALPQESYFHFQPKYLAFLLFAQEFESHLSELSLFSEPQVTGRPISALDPGIETSAEGALSASR